MFYFINWYIILLASQLMILFEASTLIATVLYVAFFVTNSNACVVYITIRFSFLHLIVAFVELTAIACVPVVRIATVTTQSDFVGLICVQAVTAHAII